MANMPMQRYSVAQLDELRQVIEQGRLGRWRIGRVQWEPASAPGWERTPDSPGGYVVWLVRGLGEISLELPTYQPVEQVWNLTMIGERIWAQRERERDPERA